MLVRAAVRSPADRLLDPSCGDGRFLAHHANSSGVERDARAAAAASERAPLAHIHNEEFFAWAQPARQTGERFDCVVGNPPFIRYQTFAGDARRRALELCAELGVSPRIAVHRRSPVVYTERPVALEMASKLWRNSDDFMATNLHKPPI